MNKEIMKHTGFAEQVDLVEDKKCPLCSKDIKMDSFRDKLSVKEYHISGMCQQCQDDIFGPTSGHNNKEAIGKCCNCGDHIYSDEYGTEICSKTCEREYLAYLNARFYGR